MTRTPRWRDDDPGLPIKLGPCSNGEYDPVPLSPVAREAMRRARESCESNARLVGVSRRQFLLSVCGAATTLLAIDACSKEAARQQGAPAPGGTFTIPTTATTEPEVATTVLSGEEVIFDVQAHLLEYAVNPGVGAGRTFWDGFPQQDCGEDDPRICFSTRHFMEDIFLKSDTNMVVLSALPIAPESSPLSPEIMDDARRLAERLCMDDRVLMQAQALPNVGDLQANLDAMEAAVARYPIAAWKVFTNYPDLYDGTGNAWRLDDGDPGLAIVGEAFVAKAVELGVRIICAHKGLSRTSPYGSPVDIGPAARAHPDMSFVAYHSGYEARQVEGAYEPATADLGVNRLIASLEASGIGPNQNAYAELGTTWWSLLAAPDQAAHVLGKLLTHVGEDNVLWGTDSIFYGSPQDQIQAFRAFQITPELQERYGYPALTDEIKRKVLGGNAARLYGVDPVATACAFSRDELEQIRLELPSGNDTFGPTTLAERGAYLSAHRGP